MRKRDLLFVLSLVIVVVFLHGCTKEKAIDPKEFTDGNLIVEPDESKYVHALAEEGYIIYSPHNKGYRYGPTIFVNADGSIDAWFASPGGAGQWDWIYYRSSTDGGKTWSEEHCAIQGTPDSMDLYSTCDPGVVKIGEYYYLGYTSTVDLGGVANNLFVARSKDPKGPYDKWNGSGWGGDPWPVIYYDEDPSTWGAGEPSFVLMGDKLYIYYSWKTKDKDGKAVNSTRLAIADATDPNWPATLEYKGDVLDGNKYNIDSADVKFIDDFGKFVAVAAKDRFTTSSSMAVFDSVDGINFRATGTIKTNIAQYAHNCGISGRPNGHIRLKDPAYLSYSFGEEVPVWATYFHPITWYEDESDADPERKGRNRYVKVELSELKDFVGTALVVSPTIIEIYEGQLNVPIPLAWYDGWFRGFGTNPNAKGIKYYGYDKKIVEIKDGKVSAVSTGITPVHVELDGFRFTFKVFVYPKKDKLSRDKVVEVKPVIDEYNVSLDSNIEKQIRVLVRFEDYTWTETELRKHEEGEGVNLMGVVSFSDYDTNLISISENGFITPKAKGTTEVTVSYGGLETKVRVVVE